MSLLLGRACKCKLLTSITAQMFKRFHMSYIDVTCNPFYQMGQVGRRLGAADHGWQS